MINRRLPFGGGLKDYILMTVKKQLDELRKEWTAARTEEERKAVDEKIRELSENNPKAFETAFYEGLRSSAEAYRSGKVIDALEPVVPALRFAYIAENYFHHSGAWLSQRLHGAVVNGRRVAFAPEETKTLVSALRSLSERLRDAADRVEKI